MSDTNTEQPVMNDGTIEIKHVTCPMEEVMGHFAKGFGRPKDGIEVVDYEWAYNPETGKVMWQLFIRDPRNAQG